LIIECAALTAAWRYLFYTITATAIAVTLICSDRGLNFYEFLFGKNIFDGFIAYIAEWL
jgi:hypothetical protein